jgi:hypothetical protein
MEKFRRALAKRRLDHENITRVSQSGTGMPTQGRAAAEEIGGSGTP